VFLAVEGQSFDMI